MNVGPNFSTLACGKSSNFSNDSLLLGLYKQKIKTWFTNVNLSSNSPSDLICEMTKSDKFSTVIYFRVIYIFYNSSNSQSTESDQASIKMGSYTFMRTINIGLLVLSIWYNRK